MERSILLGVVGVRARLSRITTHPSQLTKKLRTRQLRTFRRFVQLSSAFVMSESFPRLASSGLIRNLSRRSANSELASSRPLRFASSLRDLHFFRPSSPGFRPGLSCAAAARLGLAGSFAGNSYSKLADSQR